MNRDSQQDDSRRSHTSSTNQDASHQSQEEAEAEQEIMDIVHRRASGINVNADDLIKMEYLQQQGSQGVVGAVSVNGSGDIKDKEGMDKCKDTETPRHHSAQHADDAVRAKIGIRSSPPRRSYTSSQRELGYNSETHDPSDITATSTTPSNPDTLPAADADQATSPASLRASTVSVADFPRGSVGRSQRGPGAYESGMDMAIAQDEEEGDVDPFADSPEMIIQEEEGEAAIAGSRNLAVASPVDRLSELPQAQQIGTRSEDGETKRCHNKVIVLLGSLLLVAVVVILVMALGNNEDSLPDNNYQTELGAIPSAAPTSLEDYVLALLPPDTTKTIQEHPNSPQSKALSWLLEEGEDLVGSKYTPSRVQQKIALATLYYSTQGSQWTNQEGWLDHSTHECDWFNQEEFGRRTIISSIYAGFLQEWSNQQPQRCNWEGQYLNLWLDNNNLQGALPPELFLMTALQSISVAANQLQGPIPTQIGLVTQLEGLYLQHMTENAGSVPSQLGLLTNMRSLLLADSQITGTIPTELWQLSDLETLIIQNIPTLSGTFSPPIGAMEDLRWMVFDRWNLVGTIPSEVGLLTSLEWFITVATPLTGTIPPITQLSNLLYLSSFFTELTGTIPELGTLTALTGLKLGDNHLSGTIPSEIGLLTNLNVTVELQNNELLEGTLPTELGLLVSLPTISFYNNQFTGLLPSELAQMPKLGMLHMGNNSLSGSVPSQYASSLGSTLHTLNLVGNPSLSGTIPNGLCSLNGTCREHPFSSCKGNYGLEFDCTAQLCGCSCVCGIELSIIPIPKDQGSN